MKFLWVSHGRTISPGRACSQKTESDHLLSQQGSNRIESSIENSIYHLRDVPIVTPYSTVRQAFLTQVAEDVAQGEAQRSVLNKKAFGSLTNEHITCRIEEERRKGKHVMADLKRWPDTDDGSLYSLPNHDVFGVLSSTRNVVEQSEHVRINPEQVHKLSKQWIQAIQAGTQPIAPSIALWNNHYHFNDGTERTVNWVLVLDTLNFCFWAEKDQPRWSIDYNGEILNGYWAEAAALKRAVEEGIPLWDAEHLSTTPYATVANIFRGTPTSPLIPLFEQRVHNLHETGRVLLKRFRGQFATAIEQAQGSAVQLALLLAQHFPSFQDVASYCNQQVRFFKRAQICVADLHSTFGGKQWGAFTDIDQLTIFADYKLPQVLRQYSIIEYSSSLAGKVDSQELLTAGSEEEIEIRAATIWACELLRRSMLQLGYSMSAAEIDQRLWLLGQQLTEARPYHRTRTIHY